MKQLILSLAALLSVAAHAEEGNDTTFTVKDKKIVVDIQDDKTTVKVYDSQGYRMSKTREAEFVDGREVEQVYVGSPFIPAENLQNLKFRPRFASVWFGMHTLGKSPFSSNCGDVNSRRSKSFTLGFTPWSLAVPFNKSCTIGMMAGVQLAWVHQCFQRGYALGQDGPLFTYTPLDRRAEGNNINYGVLRVPLMLSWQQDYEGYSFNIGVSGEVRTNAAYRFTPADGTTANGVPDDLRLKRFGLNFEVGFSISPLTVHGSFGLTPLFKTATGAKAYTAEASIGLNVLELIRMIKK